MWFLRQNFFLRQQIYMANFCMANWLFVIYFLVQHFCIIPTHSRTKWFQKYCNHPLLRLYILSYTNNITTICRSCYMIIIFKVYTLTKKWIYHQLFDVFFCLDRKDLASTSKNSGGRQKQRRHVLHTYTTLCLCPLSLL